MSTGESYFSQKHLYQDYKNHIPLLKDHALTITQALDRSILRKDSPFATLDESQYGLFKYQGSLNSGYVIMNLVTGQFVSMVE